VRQARADFFFISFDDGKKRNSSKKRKNDAPAGAHRGNIPCCCSSRERQEKCQARRPCETDELFGEEKGEEERKEKESERDDAFRRRRRLVFPPRSPSLSLCPLIYLAQLQFKQMESLESFLFGDKGEAVRDLGREEALANEPMAQALPTSTATAARNAAAATAEPPLFFEDRAGGAGDEGGEGASTSAAAAAAAARVTRRSAAAAAAAAAAASADAATPTTPTPTTTQTAAVVVAHTAAAPRAAAAAAAAAAAPRATSTAAWSDPYVETAVVDLSSGAARWRKLRNDDEGAQQKVPVAGGEFERRLRRRVTSTSGSRARAWASKAKAEALRRNTVRESNDEDGPSTPDVLASGASLLAGPSAATATATAAGSSRLEVSRLTDANAADASDAVVSSVDFHASGQLLLTAGMDKRLRFFQADGGKNARLQSLFLEDMPIRQAAFCGASGNQALAVGRRPFLYVFDLGSGRAERVQKPLGREERTFEAFAVKTSGGSGSGSDGDLVALLGNRGCIPLLSLKSRCLAGELRTAGGTVRAAAFSTREDHVLFATGGDGVVHSWDLRTRRCLGRASDEGAVSGTALACGGGWLAAGSDSGVVNVYGRGRDGTLLSSLSSSKVLFGGGEDEDLDNDDPLLLRSPCSASRPTPARSLLNLTTTIDTLAFSPGGEVLVMASRMRRDALRVCSGADLRVYANWPSSRTPLGHVHSAAFSPGGGLLAIGNAKGKCLLYRINHLPVV